MTSDERHEQYLSDMLNKWAEYEQSEAKRGDKPTTNKIWHEYAQAKIRWLGYCEAHIEQSMTTIDNSHKQIKEYAEAIHHLSCIIQDNYRRIEEEQKNINLWQERIDKNGKQGG